MLGWHVQEKLKNEWHGCARARGSRAKSLEKKKCMPKSGRVMPINTRWSCQISIGVFF